MVLPNPLGRTSRWKWDETTGRYIYKSTGRAVKFSVIRNAFEKTFTVSSKRMESLAAQLLAGKMPLSVWQLNMSVQIKLVHMASAAAARGGWTRMSPADWKFANSLIKQQMNFLSNFAKEIRTKKQPLDGTLLQRAGLYGSAGRSTFEEVRRKYEEESNGKTEEKLELGAADHCVDCLEDAAQGWVPIGTLDPIGSRICSTNCHCRFDFR